MASEDPLLPQRSRKVLYLLGNLTQGGAEQTIINLATDHRSPFETQILAFSREGSLLKEKSQRLLFDDLSSRCRAPGASLFKQSIFGFWNKLRKQRWRYHIDEKLKRSQVSFCPPDVINPSLAARINEVLRKWQPDLVVTTLLESGGTLACRFVLPRLQHPPRWIIREANHPERSVECLNRAVEDPLELIRYVHGYADCIVACAEDIRHQLVQYGLSPDQIRTIRNGVRENILLALDGTVPACLPDGFNILAIGRLHPQKRFDRLLKAFQLFLRQNPAYLHILGDGPLKDELIQQAKELGLDGHLHLHGSTDPVPFLKAANAFILSSDYEGYPNALLEALAAGLPCVAHDCEFGPREMIEHESNGLLCNATNPKVLTDALMRLYRNPELAKRLGRVARERARLRTFADTRRDYEALYEELLT